jgi:hypothetical protein
VLAIVEQVAAAVAEVANKKNKGVTISATNVKAHLFLFVNCLIDNPAFDSQTKETLTTRAKDFGSTAEPSEKLLKGLLNSGIVERVLSWAKHKADRAYRRKRRARLRRPGLRGQGKPHAQGRRRARDGKRSDVVASIRQEPCLVPGRLDHRVTGSGLRSRGEGQGHGGLGPGGDPDPSGSGGLGGDIARPRIPPHLDGEAGRFNGQRRPGGQGAEKAANQGQDLEQVEHGSGFRLDRDDQVRPRRTEITEEMTR